MDADMALKVVPTLLAEIERLKQQIAAQPAPAAAVSTRDEAAVTAINKLDFDQPLTFVIFGATGDLAKKKLFPALAALMQMELIPQNSNIVAYARSAYEKDAFIQKQCVNVKGTDAEKAHFFSRIAYFQGQYDSPDDYKRLDAELLKYEGAAEGVKGNRVYFLSVPPTIFGAVCTCIKQNAESKTGYTHLVIEKPFGRDSASFDELNKCTSSLFREDQLFRIDHYMGKEVVLNLATLRFSNAIFKPMWNREHIESVQITFKEDLGTGGRGGYFDKFGIIRDIMQNHLLQVFNFIAMEPPKSLNAEDIAAAKCELLKSVDTLTMDDVTLGQFTSNTFVRGNAEHTEPGYLDDETVPEGSQCPTFAMLRLRVNNARWQDERMAEVRIVFQASPGHAKNELVMRIQPNEAIYFRVNNKRPGLQYKEQVSVLDLSYANEFKDAQARDAYERMFLNAAKGDNSLFVGSDELVEAWRIFTPVLHAIDAEKPAPSAYKFGQRGPAQADDFARKHGVQLTPSWEEFLATNAGDVKNMQALFMRLCSAAPAQGGGRKLSVGGNMLTREGVVQLARDFYDGREPSDKLVDKIMGALGSDHDGTITWEQFQKGAHFLLTHLDVPDGLSFSSTHEHE